MGKNQWVQIADAVQIEQEKRLSLISLICDSVTVVWKDWPKDMHLSSVDREGKGLSLSGKCPHCEAKAAFISLTTPYVESLGGSDYKMLGALRCIACNEFILGILRSVPGRVGGYPWAYEAHYPLGLPNDSVAEEIPPDIATDFSEALRCRWVKAYNATVEMCRRALASSCLNLGADPKLTLIDQIDWLGSQGKITTPLKDMAHKIRLGGNRGAHPPEQKEEPTITDKDADAVIEFTRHYFQHVYVMPASLAKFDFSKERKKN